jgi:predicted hotdog family 3-hydroxylacyl-ACP dehydratase
MSLDYADQLKQLAGMPASKFVLHRESMLLIDRLVDVTPESGLCEWRVSDSNAFLVPDIGVPAYVGVEYMAQGVAAFAGARARVRGYSPPLGFLLGTRHYQSRIQYFKIDETYQMACTELMRDSAGMGSYDCEILHQGSVVVTARLTVLEKERGAKLDE